MTRYRGAATLAVFCFVMSSHAQNLHVGIIHGDRDYTSSQRKSLEDPFTVVDGAQSTYLSLLKRAQRDEHGTYVIHYDPKGSGGFLSASNMKTHVFDNSKARFFWARGESHPTDYPSHIQKGLSKSLRTRWDKSYFYYFGEQPSLEGRLTNYDSGSPSKDFTLSDLQQLISDSRPDPMHPWTRAIIQSCNIENLDWVLSLSGIVDELVIPVGTVASLPPLFEKLWTVGTLPRTQWSLKRWDWISISLNDNLMAVAPLVEAAKRNRSPRHSVVPEAFASADQTTGPWRITMDEFPLWTEQWDSVAPEIMNIYHEVVDKHPVLKRLTVQISN